MARVKRAVNAQKKRRVVLERASGYRGQRSRLYRKAKEQVTHSLGYAYRDRRAKKGDFRRLWIQRINAGARANGMTYNRFIQGLKAAEIEVDRRMLAELAVNDAAAFTALVEISRAQRRRRRPRPTRRPSACLTHERRDPRARRGDLRADQPAIRSGARRCGRCPGARCVPATGRFLAEGPRPCARRCRHRPELRP